MRTASNLYVGIAAMALSLYAQAYPGESIVRDPVTGNYTITYVGDSPTQLSQSIFVPSTKIVPTIRSSFRMGERGVIMYRYTVSNGTSAKQAIVGVVLDQIVNPIVGEPVEPDIAATQATFNAYYAAQKAAIASPVGWIGSIIRIRSDNLDRLAWRPSSDDLNINGIPAGRTLSGFGFNSLDLPGVGPSQMDGMGEVLGFPDDGPDSASAIFDQLNQLRDNDFIVRNTAVPSIAVPVPFDVAMLLDRIRSQMLTWSGKQLLDPAFAAQLDRNMVAAANAYRSNQSKAGKENIESVRNLLEHEHKYLDHDEEDHEDTAEHKAATRLTIDRLAARVLDFDLRYVLKRMEREHEHEDGDRRKDR